MHAASAPGARIPRLVTAGIVVAAALVLSAAAEGAGGAPQQPPCPLTASALSTAVGRTLQRVNLSDPKGDPAEQCAFAVVTKGSKPGTPQVYLTTTTGTAGDLRDMYAYYVQARSKLATKPRVTSRPDLGPGAFTLTATTVPVTTLYVMLGKGVVGTLSVDLTDAPAGKREPATVEKVIALVVSRPR